MTVCVCVCSCGSAGVPGCPAFAESPDALLRQLSRGVGTYFRVGASEVPGSPVLEALGLNLFQVSTVARSITSLADTYLSSTEGTVTPCCCCCCCCMLLCACVWLHRIVVPISVLSHVPAAPLFVVT
jgi:hypothetical protein